MGPGGAWMGSTGIQPPDAGGKGGWGTGAPLHQHPTLPSSPLTLPPPHCVFPYPHPPYSPRARPACRWPCPPGGWSHPPPRASLASPTACARLITVSAQDSIYLFDQHLQLLHLHPLHPPHLVQPLQQGCGAGGQCGEGRVAESAPHTPPRSALQPFYIYTLLPYTGYSTQSQGMTSAISLSYCLKVLEIGQNIQTFNLYVVS